MKKRNRYNNSVTNNSEDDLQGLYRDGQSDNIGIRFVYFIVGLALLCGGLFLIFQNTTLSTNFTLIDIMVFTPPFGVVLIPFIIGVGVLFFNEKSFFGWLLTIMGLVIIVLGILMGLRIYFNKITLAQGVIMFGMTAAGAGLTLKAFAGKRA
jgi:FtsH-binding integral membrane protein